MRYLQDMGLTSKSNRGARGASKPLHGHEET
jgi:hypothetical protein